LSFNRENESGGVKSFMVDISPRADNPYAAYTFNWNVYNQAYGNFVDIFGRNPTKAELALVEPHYNYGDPNISDQVGGRAAIASLYQQELAAGYSASGNPAKLDTAPAIASGNPPFNGVSTAAPEPGNGASNLPMGVSMNAYSPSYIAPVGGVPAPDSAPLIAAAAGGYTPATAPLKAGSNFLFFAALAVGGFVLMKRLI
jgi:hypothetical protein